MRRGQTCARETTGNGLLTLCVTCACVRARPMGLRSQGDSGAPVVRFRDGSPVLVGLASSGVGCTTRQAPSLLVRVDAYVGWMRRRNVAVQVVEINDSPPCAKGWEPRIGKCRFCGAGSVSEGGRQGKCRKCANGLVVDEKDRSQCTCKGVNAVGKGLRNGFCVVCASGRFSGVGDEMCRKCPQGLVTRGKGAERCF